MGRQKYQQVLERAASTLSRQGVEGLTQADQAELSLLSESTALGDFNRSLLVRELFFEEYLDYTSLKRQISIDRYLEEAKEAAESAEALAPPEPEEGTPLPPALEINEDDGIWGDDFIYGDPDEVVPSISFDADGNEEEEDSEEDVWGRDSKEVKEPSKDFNVEDGPSIWDEDEDEAVPAESEGTSVWDEEDEFEEEDTEEEIFLETPPPAVPFWKQTQPDPTEKTSNKDPRLQIFERQESLVGSSVWDSIDEEPLPEENVALPKPTAAVEPVTPFWAQTPKKEEPPAKKESSSADVPFWAQTPKKEAPPAKKESASSDLPFWAQGTPEKTATGTTGSSTGKQHLAGLSTSPSKAASTPNPEVAIQKLRDKTSRDLYGRLLGLTSLVRNRGGE